MNRRNFIGKTARLGACSLIGVSLLTQSGCASYPLVKANPVNNLLKVDLTAFGEGKRLLVRTPDLEFDVFVHQFQTGQFRATLLQCSHRNEPISVSDTQIYCPSHGSTFSLEGAVTKAPATEPLKHYPVKLSDDGTSLLIDIS